MMMLWWFHGAGGCHLVYVVRSLSVELDEGRREAVDGYASASKLGFGVLSQTAGMQFINFLEALFSLCFKKNTSSVPPPVRP